MDAFVGTWKARQPANEEEKAQFIAFCIAEADGGTGGSFGSLNIVVFLRRVGFERGGRASNTRSKRTLIS